MGVVSRRSRRIEQDRSRGKIHLLGDEQTLPGSGRLEGRVGQRSPGTRTSLYQNAQYLKAAPFAELTLKSMDAADPLHPTVKPAPYTGIQFVAIPEFQGIGTTVGQDFSAALAGSMSVDEALAKAQASTEATMKKAGYYD